MTLSDFKDLDEKNQIKNVWQHGTFLAERTDENCRYVLYKLKAFYVEFTYGIGDIIQQQIRTFATTALLEPYLATISI